MTRENRCHEKTDVGFPRSLHDGPGASSPLERV